MHLRPAVLDDLQSLCDIYNHEVLNGVATFDTSPVDTITRRPWFDAHNNADHPNHPLYVAEDETGVIGYVSLSTFNPKPAYDSTVELSVYVAPNARGKGIGKAMVLWALDFCRQDAITRRIISLVTANNAASNHLHKNLGFRHVGTLTEAGVKFGQLLDVEIWEFDATQM